MKRAIAAKYQQHLDRNKERGFTLIELIIVSFIIGILSAIALPSLLSKTNKAKQAEARQNIGAIIRAQETYFLEKRAFTNSIKELGKGEFKTETENFTYWIRTSGKYVFNYATPKKPNLKNYVGVVYGTTEKIEGIETMTVSELCESPSPDTTAVIYKNGVPVCTRSFCKPLLDRIPRQDTSDRP